MRSRPTAAILSTIAILAASCGEHQKPTVPDPPVSDLGALPAATFSMGSPSGEPGRRPDEVSHLVTLTRRFQISRHEVTQSEWQSVMGWIDSEFHGADRPVERVTWFDGVEFCNRLSALEQLVPAYAIEVETYVRDHITAATVTWNREADGYRLPTEAEWEYACRGRMPTGFCNGEITNPGNDSGLGDCVSDPRLEAVGWYCNNGAGVTQTVQGKAPNGWGVFDMHGNVYEWCWDWYGSYDSEPLIDPEGAASGLHRCVRGGSWSSLPKTCRSASRYHESPANGTHGIGLRVARSIR